jgi:predicted acetyltransferase
MHDTPGGVPSTAATATASRPSAGIEIRQATAESLRSFTGPLERAFGEEFTDAEFADWVKTFDPERVFGAFEGDTAVGTSGAYTFRLTVPGGADIGAGGVTIVGVSPTHRRRGILRAMMRRLIDDSRDRGEPVAVLWASEGAIYQRFGYGLATLNGTFDIERTRVSWLRPVEPIGQVRIVDADEATATFPGVYDAIRPSIPGALSRDEMYWRWSVLHDAEYMRHGHGPKFRALLEIDGEPRGYAIYRMKQEWEDRGPRYQVLVFEVAGTSVDVERAMWAWVMDLDLVHNVRAWRQPVPHPLQLQLTEPRRLGLLAADGIWLRIVDLPAALEARTYARAGEIVLGVEDDFCPWNHGAWRLQVPDDGRATVTRSESQPELTMTAADLGAVYLGGFSFGDLARAGRVAERRPAALVDADRLFATERAPWCATGF